jgi:predicted transposase/invertase (TIGR01784 family)
VLQFVTYRGLGYLMSRYLDPKSDLVFKRVFGEHPHLLKSFLNAVLPLAEDELIESLEYLQAEQIPVIPILKRTIVDVKCKDHKGCFFVVEMQLEWTSSFMQRMLFGTSQAYVKQLGKGQDYRLLNPVYGLGLLNEVFDKETVEWYHHYKLINVENTKQEIKGLQIVFLELPKFHAKTVSDKKLQVLWLRFLSEIGEATKIVDSELLAIPEIKEAISFTEESAYTPAQLETYNKYWDAISTERTLLAGKYDDGKAEGLAEKDKAIKDIAKNLLAQGLSLAAISQATGLKESELKKL